MSKIPHIDVLISLRNNCENSLYFDSIYIRLQEAIKFYPDFESWYYDKVIPDLLSNKRKFLLQETKNKISGVAIVKYDEKKLCTLKIFDGYQNRGYGLSLFEKSFEELNTDKPFLTVSEEKYFEFKKIFDYYGFNMTDIKKNIYRKDKLEYFFNQY